MRQNPTREGFGITFPGSFPISEDGPSDHGVEQVTILERRFTNQGDKRSPTHACTPPTNRNINEWGGWERPGMERGSP